MASRFLIVGLGNPLMADDGAGPAVARRLLSADLPLDVRVEIGDTDALRIISLWRGEPEVWVVDALAKGGEAGQRYRLDHREVLSLPQPHATAHSLSLPECLRWIALTSPEMAGVRYRLYGIEPGTIDTRLGLSPSVERAVVEMADEILADLRVAGAEPGPG